MKMSDPAKVGIVLLVLRAALSLPAHGATGKTTKESFISNGAKRTYVLFVPASLSPSVQVPLLITFHGSNRDGMSLLEKWRDLAGKERFIVASPDSKESRTWNAPNDGPGMIYELAEMLKEKYPIDPLRIYLFGHSAGAVFAINLGLMESEYFAAVAVHAGAFRDDSEYQVVNYAERKIPLIMFVGDRDQFFPLTAARQTRDTLLKVGFPVELKELPLHDHWYYDMAPDINRKAWEFLRSKQLDATPHYEPRYFK